MCPLPFAIMMMENLFSGKGYNGKETVFSGDVGGFGAEQRVRFVAVSTTGNEI
jgi:hypothetical protein